MIDVVCGVIEDDGGRFLACLRPEGKHLAGKWEFPGGKVEPGEDARGALTRELREELEIGVRVGDALHPVIWTNGGAPIRLLPFRCRITEGRPRAVEHASLRWCSVAELPTLDWAEADLPVLAELLASE